MIVELNVTLGYCGSYTAQAALNIVNDRSDVTVDALWPQNIHRDTGNTAQASIMPASKVIS